MTIFGRSAAERSAARAGVPHLPLRDILPFRERKTVALYDRKML